jgi:hypothetical protein
MMLCCRWCAWYVCRAAVLVWSRALGLMTPLSSKLGAMLYILRRAAEEVGVLVPVVLTLMVVSKRLSSSAVAGSAAMMPQLCPWSCRFV